MVAAREVSVQKLLEGTSQYLVPLYQRPYQWGPDNFKVLWNDVLQLVEDRPDDPLATHFMGSLVLAPVPDNIAGSVTRYLVVDGQQRLTTVTLLLAAIRDHLRENEPASQRVFDRIHNQLLTNQYEDDPYRLKLVPTQADRHVYSAVIDASPTAGGDDAVGGAYRFFRARLSDLSAIDEQLTAIQIYDAVTCGLSVVSISTDPRDNVHRIFQSLNNTGLQLTQGDLLRNYLFMRMPDRGEEIHRKFWRPLEEALDSNDQIETLFWLDLVHRRPIAKRTQTFTGQQARIDRFTDEAAVVSEVERIARLGGLYRLMLHPSEETDPAVRERLARLAEWDSTTPAPLVLHLLVLRDQGEASSEQVARALLCIESLLVRRFLVGRATQGLNRLFPAAVQELDSSLPVDEALHRYLSEGRKHYATDDQLLAAILTSPLFVTGRAAHRKTMLTWIERLFGSKEIVDDAKLSIEHVMPQTLSREWCEQLAALHGADNIDEIHDRLVHTLGNLTLTGYNENMGNREFDYKRKILRASSIRMNQRIASGSEWGPEQIEQRGRDLAARIITAWPGPVITGKASPEDSPLWHSLNQLLALLPAGRWTTYGDLAKAIGTGPQAVGNRIATSPAPKSHRVLNVQGQVSEGFRWLEPERTDDPRKVLEQEGLRFSAAGKADPTQRLSTADLEQLRAAADDEIEVGSRAE